MTVFTPLSEPTHSPSGELAYFAIITPNEASTVLSTRNFRNRNLKGLAKIDGITRDITENRFVLNGETIKFNRAEELYDGQHRLTSVVRSDKPIVSLVIENAVMEAQDTTDTGSKRSVSDQLLLGGYKNTSAKAAVAKNILIYDTEGSIRNTGSKGFKPSDTEIKEFVENHDDALEHTFERIYNEYRTSALRLFEPSVAAAVHFICAEIIPEEADKFFGEQLVRGTSLTEGDPALAFRRFNMDSHKRNLRKHEQYGYLAKAWDYYRRGIFIRTLRGPNDGWTLKNLPKLNLETA